MPSVSRFGDKMSNNAEMQALTTDVFINGKRAVTVDSPVTDGDTMITGSDTVFVNGKKLCRVGDVDSAQDVATEGSPNVTSA